MNRRTAVKEMDAQKEEINRKIAHTKTKYSTLREITKEVIAGLSVSGRNGSRDYVRQTGQSLGPVNGICACESILQLRRKLCTSFVSCNKLRAVESY